MYCREIGNEDQPNFEMAAALQRLADILERNENRNRDDGDFQGLGPTTNGGDKNCTSSLRTLRLIRKERSHKATIALEKNCLLGKEAPFNSSPCSWFWRDWKLHFQRTQLYTRGNHWLHQNERELHFGPAQALGQFTSCSFSRVMVSMGFPILGIYAPQQLHSWYRLADTNFATETTWNKGLDAVLPNPVRPQVRPVSHTFYNIRISFLTKDVEALNHHLKAVYVLSLALVHPCTSRGRPLYNNPALNPVSWSMHTSIDDPLFHWHVDETRWPIS
ncbi:hypothetical protein VNO77_03216 [Canavalia gladiata]|uniref:Uncharacterized protein n=1 Tax=Canavalia gladiata TaxID=3824 RepID=A0AAN9MUC6_CANGL